MKYLINSFWVLFRYINQFVTQNSSTVTKKLFDQKLLIMDDHTLTYDVLKMKGVPERWIAYILKSPNDQKQRLEKYRAWFEKNRLKLRLRQHLQLEWRTIGELQMHELQDIIIVDLINLKSTHKVQQ